MKGGWRERELRGREKEKPKGKTFFELLYPCYAL
jgi:hypothetical protein